MLDRAPQVVEQIGANIRMLGLDQVTVERADALTWLSTAEPRPMDLVFLDPPFGQDLLGPSCEALESGGWLAPGAAIYLESAARESEPDLPPSWKLHREKRAGEVCYRLFVRPE